VSGAEHLAAAPCRVVVLISGSGSNLQALIDAATNPANGYEVVAVLSNKPGVYGLERARRAGIDTAVVAHGDFPSRDAFDRCLGDTIEGFAPDLILLAGFMRILTPAFVDRFRGQLINIHPSLLPRYPGLHTHQRALDAGDAEAGCSVHFVTEQLDGGPVIVQATVPIAAGDDADSLAQRVLQQEHRIFPLAASWFARGHLRLRGHQALFDGAALPPQGRGC